MVYIFYYHLAKFTNFYADIKFALKDLLWLRGRRITDYGTLSILDWWWCDGNPFVPGSSRNHLQRHSKAALKTYYQYLLKLRTELSLSSNKIKLDAAFKRSLRKEQEQVKLDISRFTHFEHEPNA